MSKNYNILKRLGGIMVSGVPQEVPRQKLQGPTAPRILALGPPKGLHEPWYPLCLPNNVPVCWKCHPSTQFHQIQQYLPPMEVQRAITQSWKWLTAKGSSRWESFQQTRCSRSWSTSTLVLYLLFNSFQFSSFSTQSSKPCLSITAWDKDRGGEYSKLSWDRAFFNVVGYK